jgi:cobalt-zinc-cadmium resistance protein CzcA
MESYSKNKNSFFYRFVSALIAKQYFVLFVVIAVIVFGVISYRNLPLEAYPDVANMQVRVISQLPGKAPEEVERLVTIPIEKEVNGIPHAKPPRSISIFGLSVITIVFDDEAEPYTARQQVLERLSQADIPDYVEPHLDPNASAVGEIFRYTLQGKDWSSRDRKEVQDWLLNRLFKSVDGIVDATGFGGPTKIFLVEMDPGRLRALGLSQNEVSSAIARANDSTGGSYIVHNDQRYMVRGLGLLKSARDIGCVVIRNSSEGVPIRVQDVADVKISDAVRKGQVGLDGDDDAVEGILMMRRGDNPSRVIGKMNEVWEDFQSQLPKGMKMVVLQDRTALVNKTVGTIGHNVGEGIILVVLILMFFLLQVRSALICAIVIPCALLGASILMRGMNIPANLLSLGAIDFGIIVDGAVIMIENINRRLGTLQDASPAEVRDAICSSAAEVAKPVIFSTLIIAMTFLPILSFEHVEGRLFKPLAILMNLVLVVAAITTIAVLPVVCNLVFKNKPPVPRESPIVLMLEHAYGKIVPFLQKYSRTVIAGFLIFATASFSILPFLGSEFIPELEEGNIWLTVYVLPPSVTLERSVEIAHDIRRVMRSYPETKSALTQIGSPDDGTDPNPYNMIEVLVNLNPQEEWRKEFRNKEELVDSMQKQLDREVPGLIMNFSQCIKDSMEEAMSGVKNGEYAIKIFGPDINKLESLSDEVSDVLRTVPGIVDIAHDNLTGQPQLTIEIDRERAARHGISTSDILDIVETSIGGKAVTRVIDGERRFDVVLRLKEAYRGDYTHVGDLLVTSPSGVKIPLRQLAQLKMVEGANSILREDNKRRIAVYSNIRGRDLGSAVLESKQKVAAQIVLPPGYSLSYAGEFARAEAAGKTLLIVVPITLLLIFALLYFAFDSAELALLTMTSVPVAAAVSMIVLFVSGTHISISSGVGLIALFGLSIQNAVIIVSKMRESMKKELGSVDMCIAVAARQKLNAVLIAALVAAVGLAPAALSNGIGSQSQKPFAIVISCGILPATLLTLFLLPVLARYIVRKNKALTCEKVEELVAN